MIRRLPARASVLASVVFALATFASACTDTTGIPGDPTGSALSGEDTMLRRGSRGNSGKGTVTSVEISPATFALSAGGVTSLSAVARNSQGRSIDKVATWASSDLAVATVDAGQVKAIKPGTALITAVIDGMADTATARVSSDVIVVDSVIVSPGVASVIIGESITMTARPVDSTGSTLADRPVSWASSDASIATVSSTGRVTGVAQGSAEVQASSEGKSSEVVVNVAPVPVVPVASVAIAPSPASVKEGATLTLSVTTTDANGDVLTGRTVTWVSSNEDVVKVSATGVLTGTGAGNATVTATSEGKETPVNVSVTPSTIPVASISMSQASGTIAAGASLQLVATPKDGSGNELSGRSISWSTSNGLVATVSSSGLVQGVAAGSATIRASAEGKSGTSAITVTAPAPAPPPPSEPPPTEPAPSERVGYYVSPTGSSGGAGTRSSPWSLSSVLSGSKSIAPGDTVWVLGGTYRGQFSSQLNGSSSRQIVVRAYPGQRATIDGSVIVYGSYASFWGLEVMNSSPVGAPTAVTVMSRGARLINLVVHDGGRMGVAAWTGAPDAVIHGSIIYNNGTTENKDHGIYFNNSTGSKYLTDNIVFNNWQYGLHGYSPISGELNNLRLEGNVSFNNGSIGLNGHGPDIFVGGSTINNLVVRDNLTWSDNDGEAALRLGSGSGLTLTGNRTVGLVEVGSWSGRVEGDNTFWSSSAPPSSGVSVHVRPNAYEAGRANIIVHNWSNLGIANADVSSVLRTGDHYEVRNVQSFYGPPVLSGIYSGGSLALPMQAVQPPAPIGRGNAPGTTGTRFHVFVVIKTN